MKLWALAAAATLAAWGLSAQARAQSVETYRYDANGRLVEVIRSQGGGTITTGYGLDDAGNRQSRSVTVFAPASAEVAETADREAAAASDAPAVSQPLHETAPVEDRRPPLEDSRNLPLNVAGPAVALGTVAR